MKYRDVLATELIMALAVGGAADVTEGSGPAPAASAEFFKDQPTGGVVLVTRDDQVLLRRPYGRPEVENAVPMRPDSAPRLASIGEQFTAIAAHRSRCPRCHRSCRRDCVSAGRAVK